MAIVPDLSGNSPGILAGGVDPRIGGSYDLQSLAFKGAKQELTIGIASVQSAPFANTCRAIRIAPDTDIHYRIGDGLTVTALATDDYLAAGAVETIRVKPGQRIAAIQDSIAGACSITEDG